MEGCRQQVFFLVWKLFFFHFCLFSLWLQGQNAAKRSRNLCVAFCVTCSHSVDKPLGTSSFSCHQVNRFPHLHPSPREQVEVGRFEGKCWPYPPISSLHHHQVPFLALFSWCSPCVVPPTALGSPPMEEFQGNRLRLPSSGCSW